jgi:putative addiction module killer protein
LLFHITSIPLFLDLISVALIRITRTCAENAFSKARMVRLQSRRRTHAATKPAGEGCSELRINYGPGYRVYYKDTGKEIIVLLCGGNKSTQTRDMENAKKLVYRTGSADNGNFGGQASETAKQACQ